MRLKGPKKPFFRVRSQIIEKFQVTGWSMLKQLFSKLQSHIVFVIYILENFWAMGVDILDFLKKESRTISEKYETVES